MDLKMYQIDTFTDTLFKSNAAAICPLDNWISKDLMIKIAAENNLSETGFFVKKSQKTPRKEIRLAEKLKREYQSDKNNT